MSVSYIPRQCCSLASFPRKRESRAQAPRGLDARLRGHDVLLVPNLRNGHLVRCGSQVATGIVRKRDQQKNGTDGGKNGHALDLSTTPAYHSIFSLVFLC